VVIGGYGVSAGEGVIHVDSIAGRGFGAVMDQAYHLGEEVAEANICVCPAVRAALAQNPRFRFEAAQGEEDGVHYVASLAKIEQEHKGGAQTGASSKRAVLEMSQLDRLPASLPRGSKELYFALCHLRTLPTTTDEQERKIDAILSKDFLVRRTVMMQFFRLSSITEQKGVEAMLRVLNGIRTLLAPVFAEFQADVLESHAVYLVTFESSEEALRCALAVRAEIMLHNAKLRRENRDSEVIPMGGTGLHVSELLLVPGTDIHWGDAVNTASKLSDDAQEDGSDLIATAEVKAEIESSASGAALLRSVTFSGCSFTISKVQLTAYRVFARDTLHREGQIESRCAPVEPVLELEKL
jgi:class 3 adenylate cyclase